MLLMQNYSIVFGGFHWDVNQCLFTQIRHWQKDKTIPFLSILVNWRVYGSLYPGSWMTKKQVPYWKTHTSVLGNVWMFHSMEFLVLLTCTYTAEIYFAFAVFYAFPIPRKIYFEFWSFWNFHSHVSFSVFLGLWGYFMLRKKIIERE